MGKEVSMNEVSMVCLATHDDLNMWLWELAAKGYVFSKYARERILPSRGDRHLGYSAHGVRNVVLDHGELRTMCNTETSKSDQ